VTTEGFGRDDHLKANVRRKTIEFLSGYMVILMCFSFLLSYAHQFHLLIQIFQEAGNLLHYIAVASLPIEGFSKIMHVLKTHDSGLLLKSSKKRKEIKAYKLAFVNHLLPSELEELLQAVLDKTLSFEDAAKRGQQIKKMHRAQDALCQETSLDSWAEAELK